MAITDPVDALQQQFENEDRASNPVLSCLARVASELGVPWPADKALGSIVGWLNRNRVERIELLVGAVIQKIKAQEECIQRLTTRTEQQREEWLGLVLDGMKKAENTRAKERIHRMAAILANSLILKPTPKADETEEMMRIAMELSDLEVKHLGELVRIEGDSVGNQGRIDRYNAWQRWEQGPWGSNPNGELDSTFSKLESFGLVSRLAPPNNQNLMADLQNRFALLRKGLEFVRFAQSSFAVGA